MSALAPIVPDAEVARALAVDLRAAGFTVEGLRSLWGDDAEGALHRGDRVPALRAARDRRTPEVVDRVSLAGLFVLGVAADLRNVTAALPTVGVDALVRAGLVRVEPPLPSDGVTAHGTGTEPSTAPTDARVVPLVDLRPYAFVDDQGAGAWWIMSDLGEIALGGAALGEDHVLGIGGASTTLAGLQLPVHVDRVLDLGTGCGIQAMHARRFADHVVATDISRRALDIAAFNVALNAVDGIEFRLGSLFEPVAGERFDRIVSNPPFVITPRVDGVPEYEYRDGGMVGDGLVETVLRGVADHLLPGGTAQLLGNWEYRWGRDGLDRVAGWLSDTALDAWVIERERQDPARYAETWIRDGGTRPGTAEFDRLVGAWLDDFAARRVTGVGFGYVLLRAGAGSRPFRRSERVSEALGSNPAGLGATVARTFDAVDWLRVHDDTALGGSMLRVAGDVTEERHYWPGNEDPTVITIVQGGGFGRRTEADTALAAFVGACDGELSVRAIVDAIAELLAVDADALAADLLPRIRTLVTDGLLRP